MFDKASQASSISSGAFRDVGGLCTRVIASRERLICRAEERSAPEARASAAPRRGGGAAATLEGAAASDSPPTVKPASGGGMFDARGKIASHCGFLLFRSTAHLALVGLH